MSGLDPDASGAILWRMLDTQADRLDIAEIVRVARANDSSRAWWDTYSVDESLGVPVSQLVRRVHVHLDEEREWLIIDEGYVIELDRQRVRPPTTGRPVRGPYLARCPRGCGCRARVLWADPGEPELDFGCRACLEVVYETASSNELRRAQLAHERLRSRLGLARYETHEPRPHQKMARYRREAARLRQAKERLRAAEAGSLQSILRALG